MKINSKKADKLLGVFALLVVFGMIVPQELLAQAGENVTAAANLIPYVQPVTAYFWGILTKLTEGLSYLIFSTSLLQAAANNSAAWISIDSNFAKAGLNVTIALADVFLIAVFIAVAMGYVFKIDKLNNQKIIVRFVFTALLVHFAPLFVGMVTDIANIIVKGLLIGKEDIFTSVFTWQMGTSVLSSIVALSATYGAASLACIGGTIGTVANYGVVVLGLGNLLTGLPGYIIQVMVLDINAGLVFSYALFFLTRVFVVQTLTILAPLAILCAALPATSNYFKMWRDWLLGWAFGGILVLFLLVMGLTSLDTVSKLPGNVYTSISFGDHVFNVPLGGQFKWVVLAIYMITVEALCLALIPALAKQFERKAKEMGGVKETAGRLGNKIRNSVIGTPPPVKPEPPPSDNQQAT